MDLNSIIVGTALMFSPNTDSLTTTYDSTAITQQYRNDTAQISEHYMYRKPRSTREATPSWYRTLKSIADLRNVLRIEREKYSAKVDHRGFEIIIPLRPKKKMPIYFIPEQPPALIDPTE